MKPLLLIFPPVLASPFSLLSKRPLPRTTTSTSCPATLTPNEFEYPHYMTYISASAPDTAFGPQLSGVFTPNDMATVYSFDIPASRAGDNCTLEFLFPAGSNDTMTYSGGGSFVFTGYAVGDCPGPQTTWNNQPALGPYPPFPPVNMEPGFAYVLDIGPCSVSAGTCVAGVTTTNDTYFSYFQDYGNGSSTDCPIGIYTSYSQV